MTDPFPFELLKAVSDWQRGGDAKQNKKRGENLKEACAHLADKYRTCTLCCFRQIALPKDGVWNLIGEDCLTEKISSWTLDLELAKAFKGGVPPAGQDFQGVILCVHPKPSSIIVNLHELYSDDEFTAAMARHHASISGYADGAGRYAETQREVALEVAAVTQQDIYSLGGHSSTFEQLVDEAAEQAYGPNATTEQRAALLLKAAHYRSEAGPRWLNPEATQRVVTKMKPRAEQLREIKRLQNAGK